MVAIYSAAGTSAVEQFLQAKMANTIVLPEGTLTTEIMEDRAAVDRIKGLSLNLDALLRDTLYQPHDRVTVELHAREGCAVQRLS